MDFIDHDDDKKSKSEILEGHLEMLREMLSPNTEEWVQPPEFVPRIYFDLGAWEGEEWLPSIEGGYGVLLGLVETDTCGVKAVLGDYVVIEADAADLDESHEISRVPIVEIPITSMGSILGAAAPPEMWHVE